MRFLVKSIFRGLIASGAFLGIWATGFQIHVDRMPFFVTCGASILAVVAAARYSRREERKRRALLALILALPFLACATVSVSSAFDGIFGPFIFWAALAAGASTTSFVADSILPGCSFDERPA